MTILVSAFVVALGAALIVGADLRQRSGLLLAALSFSAIVCTWEIAFGTPTPLRGRLPLATMFFIMAAMLVVPSILTGLREHAPVASFADLMGDTPPLVNSVSILCVCFYVLLIINEPRAQPLS